MADGNGEGKLALSSKEYKGYTFSNNNNNNKTKNKNCYYCGKRGHIAQNCWNKNSNQQEGRNNNSNQDTFISNNKNKNKICYQCGKRGHIAQNCWNKDSNQQEEREELYYIAHSSFEFGSFVDGTSGNDFLDQFIRKETPQLKWIPYRKFDNVEYLDEGGFSIVYKAIWMDEDKEVVLKCLDRLDDSDEDFNEFLTEWKYHYKCKNSDVIIRLYGFTKDPDTLKYMVVMDYANEGNLRKCLTKIIKSSWRRKLHSLYKIISGLNEIHKKGLIHCDFHDGNILYNEDEIRISDLGLCRPIKSTKKNQIYGVIPFMAPEVLRGKPYTPASDIYSFSMIMWEFTSGIPPFNDRAHDLQLSLSICEGVRPKIIENTPKCYMDLMKKCWNEDPLERPSASKVLNIIEKWMINPSRIEFENISEKLRNNIMEFVNAPSGYNKLITQTHPQAFFTSQYLDFTGKELSETLLESKSLDECIVVINE